MKNHPVVWFEVNGRDAPALHRFYGAAFGWKIDVENPMGYGMVEADPTKGIPGGIGPLPSDDPPGAGVHPAVTFYVSTPSIDRTLKTIEDLGGKVLTPRTVLPGGTVLALFADLEGNAIGLVEESA